MEIENSYNREYWLVIGDLVHDNEIAEYLDIPLKEYQNILINNGAYIDAETTSDEYYFKTKKDAEKTLKDLELHYILAKLTK